MLPRRLRRLPAQEIGGGLVVLEARGLRARLLGLAFLREPPAGYALLIPCCRSVHTFGMRFALDLAWLDRDGRVMRIVDAVPPGRLRSCRDAVAVIESAAQPQDDLELLDRSEVLRPRGRVLHGDQIFE